MQLSLRLSAIADMVTEGNRLVDVGCDHGYLPVYLVHTGRIQRAIAMDVREGPLSRAREHIEDYSLSAYIECRLSDGLEALKAGEGDTLVIAGMGGPLMEQILTREHIEDYSLSAYIECRLSDGLEALKAGEGDTLVIAGMGGPLMEQILTKGRKVRDSFSELILQPQSDIPHFRRYLTEEGYSIREENIVLDGGKFYPMMKAVLLKKPAEKEQLTEEEAFFGKFLLKQRNPVLKQYLEREKRIREQILASLGEAKGDLASRRILEVREERQRILAALAHYESI